jgi:hypothetical protein
MNIEKTERGFDIIEFLDRYGNGCSLQKSSLATEDCIWLGVNESRMHLTQGQVKALLPYLQRFVDTGELGAVETQGQYMPEELGKTFLQQRIFGEICDRQRI